MTAEICRAEFCIAIPNVQVNIQIGNSASLEPPSVSTDRLSALSTQAPASSLPQALGSAIVGHRCKRIDCCLARSAVSVWLRSHAADDERCARPLHAELRPFVVTPRPSLAGRSLPTSDRQHATHLSHWIRQHINGSFRGTTVTGAVLLAGKCVVNEAVGRYQAPARFRTGS